MISEKKLLCAFIYSAYESGYCGRALSRETRQAHMQLYKDYLSNQEYYPEKEIAETQKKMMDAVKATGVRNYIYDGHIEAIVKRIEEETGVTFERATKDTLRLDAAYSCATGYYTVKEARHGFVRAENILAKTEKELLLLPGLERPKTGDLISGHWNYYLEVIPEAEVKDLHISKWKSYVARLVKNFKE